MANTASSQAETDLVSRLKHDFKDPTLLRVALTHASALDPSDSVTKSYQRLEFLGDRVLGLVVAHMMHSHFPNAEEGEWPGALTTWSNGKLVRKSLPSSNSATPCGSVRAKPDRRPEKDGTSC